MMSSSIFVFVYPCWILQNKQQFSNFKNKGVVEFAQSNSMFFYVTMAFQLWLYDHYRGATLVRRVPSRWRLRQTQMCVWGVALRVGCERCTTRLARRRRDRVGVDRVVLERVRPRLKAVEQQRVLEGLPHQQCREQRIFQRPPGRTDAASVQYLELHNK